MGSKGDTPGWRSTMSVDLSPTEVCRDSGVEREARRPGSGVHRNLGGS